MGYRRAGVYPCRRTDCMDRRPRRSVCSGNRYHSTAPFGSLFRSCYFRCLPAAVLSCPAKKVPKECGWGGSPVPCSRKASHLPRSCCGALRAPWRERLRCTQTAATRFVEVQDTTLHFSQAKNSDCILTSPLPIKQALWEPCPPPPAALPSLPPPGALFRYCG